MDKKMNTKILKELLLSPKWLEIEDLLDTIIGAKILWVVTESGSSLLKSDENHHELCRLIRNNEEGLKRCQNLQQARFKDVKRTKQLVISSCYCGLVNFAVPIIVDKNLICVIGGRFSQTEFPMTIDRCAIIANTCGLDVRDVITLAKGVKHLSRSDQRNIVSQLSLFSGMLSFLVGCYDMKSSIQDKE